jgi:hypothetical protein
MWAKGRRTHRLLGENFSLLHQLISTDEMWNRAGMKNATPRSGLAAWLKRARLTFSLTRFAGGEYDRALAIWCDGPHVFSLSMINGGPGQHANSPYYPLPFSYGSSPAPPTPAPLDVAGVSLEFASSSGGATVDGKTVAFRHGAVRAFTLDKPLRISWTIRNQ